MNDGLITAVGLIAGAVAAICLFAHGHWLWRNGDDYAEFQNDELEHPSDRFPNLHRPNKGWSHRLQGAQFMGGSVVLAVATLAWIGSRLG